VRLATRTGLASFAAATITVLAIGTAVRVQFTTVLVDRVDQQLESRAETAPILTAVALRLSQSELQAAVEGARVRTAGGTVEIGQLPDEPLPPVQQAGFSTATADGERWRLLTIRVDDIPEAGDRALVQLVAPLGEVEASSRQLRRRAVGLGLLAAIAAGLTGYLFGSVATRPLSRLRRDATELDHADPSTWHLDHDYGADEVDEVAAAFDENLVRLGEETRRRGAALDAARAFAAGATHELRTPLQGALTNLDIAASPAADREMRIESIEQARLQMQRMGSSLAAVRALADAEFADPAWFEPVRLGEVVEAVVADEGRRFPDALIEVVDTDRDAPVRAWRDGVQLAAGNLVRNALLHGVPPQGGPTRVVVTVDGTTVSVDDGGPGIPPDARERVVQRFERNTSAVGGSGLGLAIAREVAVAHGGGLTIGTSPLGGARIVLSLG
jgi:two-component system sensor histidine kinase PrrB